LSQQAAFNNKNGYGTLIWFMPLQFRYFHERVSRVWQTEGMRAAATVWLNVAELDGLVM